jgi:hypothetical protein
MNELVLFSEVPRLCLFDNSNNNNDALSNCKITLDIITLLNPDEQSVICFDIKYNAQRCKLRAGLWPYNG